MFAWLNSIRAVVVLLFALGLTIGLFIGKVPVELFAQASMLVIGAYFAKRDSYEERGK